jgi:hypothetical protein
MVNEKFSYLVVKKGITPNAEFKDESEVSTPLEKSYFWPRLILPVMKKQGHSIIDICNT